MLSAGVVLNKVPYPAKTIPPVANENSRLSRSNPVRWARPNSVGGFQYAGTNSGLALSNRYA
jgi:hypothetical protein